MTLSKHESLDGWYQSSHGDWAFDSNDPHDSDLARVEEAVTAWTEWRDFLQAKQDGKDGTLF